MIESGPTNDMIIIFFDVDSKSSGERHIPRVGILFVHTYDVLLAVTGTFSDFPSSRFSLDGSRGPFGRCCWFQLVNY